MKNKLKLVALLFAIIVLISSFCLATGEQTPIEPRTTNVEQINITEENNEAVTTNLENEATTTDVVETEEKPEIHEGDLYIFDDTVNLDKLVDGNVYIIGKDVTVTGQIAGNLFVIADNLTIGDETSASSYNGYIFYNIYALANNATLYGSCYDLYIAGKDITIEPSFYLFRDLKIGAGNANVFATIGRNVDAEVRTLNLKKDDTSYASIYGNLNYSSISELDPELLESSVYGEVNYSYNSEPETDSSKPVVETKTLTSHITSLIGKLVFTTFVWLIILWVARKFFDKAPMLISKKPAQTLGIGLLTLIAMPIICIILITLIVTIPISFIGLILYAIAIAISSSLVCISITYLLKNKFKLDKWYKLLITLLIITSALYLIKLLPIVDSLVSFIVIILGLGLFIYSFFAKTPEKTSEVVVETDAE